MSSITVEPVTPALVLGEGPHWDVDSQTLFLIDIKSAAVCRYQPATKKFTSTKLDGNSVGFAIPIQGHKDQMAVGLDRHLVRLTWDGESKKPQKVERLLSVDHDGNRWNDAKADPTGRFWGGTMGLEIAPGKFPEEAGTLYSINPDKEVFTELVKVGISNGLAWSMDAKQMYFIDSMEGKVEAFDFNATTAEMSNRRDVIDFKAKGLPGFPDGMTIDTEDKLWVACFNGGQVIRVDPSTGQILTTVPIPAPIVTSVAFGGANMDELYVTTGNVRLSEEALLKYPQSGVTFRVTGLGVKGRPGQPVNL